MYNRHSLPLVDAQGTTMDSLDRLVGHDRWTTAQLLERCRELCAERVNQHNALLVWATAALNGGKESCVETLRLSTTSSRRSRRMRFGPHRCSSYERSAASIRHPRQTRPPSPQQSTRSPASRLSSSVRSNRPQCPRIGRQRLRERRPAPPGGLVHKAFSMVLFFFMYVVFRPAGRK